MADYAKDKIKVDGITYSNVVEYCKYTGLDVRSVISKLDSGEKDMEGILYDLLDYRLNHKDHLVLNGRVFKNYEELSVYLDRPENMIRASIAFNIPLHVSIYDTSQVNRWGLVYINNVGVRVEGVLYTSIKELCHDYDVAPLLLKDSFRKGTDFLTVFNSLRGTVNKKLEVTLDDKVTTGATNGRTVPSSVFSDAVTVNGYKFDTLIDALTFLGLSRVDFITEYANGGTKEDILNRLCYEKKPPLKNRGVVNTHSVHDGKLFYTHQQFADYLGIPVHTLQQRKTMRYSYKDIIRSSIKQGKNTLTVKGVNFANVNRFAEMMGLDLPFVLAKVKGGYSHDEIFDYAVDKKLSATRELIVNGKLFYSLGDIAKSLNIPLDSVKASFLFDLPYHVHPMSPHAVAIKGVTYIKKVGVFVGGEYFTSLSAIAKRYGVSVDKLKFRINRGMDIVTSIEDIKRRERV